MRTVLIIVIIVGAAILLGWLRFSGGDGTASVTVDADKVAGDTKKAMEEGKELVEGGAKAVDDAINGEDVEEPDKDTEISVQIKDNSAPEEAAPVNQTQPVPQ